MKTNRNNNKKSEDIVYYDATVLVNEAGNVVIVPEWYEEERDPLTPNGGTLVSEGRMVMLSDGTAKYVPYNHCDEPRYTVPITTDHAKVKCYKGGTVLVVFKFNDSMSNTAMAKYLYNEAVEINQRMK